MPATNTPFPTNTPAVTQSTGASSQATPTPVPSLNPPEVGGASAQPTSAAVPSDPDPGVPFEPRPADPISLATVAPPGTDAAAPARTPQFGPSGQVLPLPPRTGDSLESGGASAARTLGFTLMGLAALLAVAEVVRLRARSRNQFGYAVDSYFDNAEHRGDWR
jgi:hypothetical protein